MPAHIQTDKCRLLIFEGIMGSGKSTATRHFGETLTAAGLQVAAYTEAADPHPVRAADDLADFFQPWMFIEASELAARARDKWGRYVEDRCADEVITIMDGQVFHGDLTNLFMMGMSSEDIAKHVSALMQVLTPLRPMIVYFRQHDLQQAIKMILDLRGASWMEYQLGWKLRSPYALQRQLSGVEGFISMYKDYRGLTDSLFEVVDCSKLAIETGGNQWEAHYKSISSSLAHLGVPI